MSVVPIVRPGSTTLNCEQGYLPYKKMLNGGKHRPVIVLVMERIG
jgi:hypothetical protein